MIFAVVTVLLLAVASVGVGWGMYQSQVGDVTALEARVMARTTAATPVEGPVDAATKAFQADPVFSSPGWSAQLEAARAVSRGVYESDVAFAGAVAGRVWWPGLAGRAKAAGARLGSFDAAASDHLELASATVEALRVCTASDQGAFLADWVKAHSGGGQSAYDIAVAAVYPALVKAAQVHVCPPGLKGNIPLPIDKNQQRK